MPYIPTRIVYNRGVKPQALNTVNLSGSLMPAHGMAMPKKGGGPDAHTKHPCICLNFPPPQPPSGSGSSPVFEFHRRVVSPWLRRCQGTAKAQCPAGDTAEESRLCGKQGSAAGRG